MLKVYGETTQWGQLPMGIQKFGTIGDVDDWTRLYKETAAELGYSADSRYNPETRMEIGLMVCRKMLNGNFRPI